MTMHDRMGWGWGLAAVVLGGCADKGSLGGYETGTDTEDGSESTASSATNSSATNSSTTNSSTSATDTEGSGSSDGGTVGDSGGGLCDQPGSCTMFPGPCGDTCGTLESNFDENGCLRQGCGLDDQCGADERCFRGQDFGLCEGSGVFCEDDLETMSCMCGSDPDCSGGHCVPAELYPETITDPDFSQPVLSNDCGPGDASLLVFVIYGDGAFSECVVEGGVEELRLAFDAVGLEVGEYEFGVGFGGAGTHRGEGGALEQVQHGTLVIDSIDGTLVSGSFRAVVSNNGVMQVLEGDLQDAPYCQQPVVCG
jgi:hypothetical protein